MGHCSVSAGHSRLIPCGVRWELKQESALNLSMGTVRATRCLVHPACIGSHIKTLLRTFRAQLHVILISFWPTFHIRCINLLIAAFAILLTSMWGEALRGTKVIPKHGSVCWDWGRGHRTTKMFPSNSCILYNSITSSKKPSKVTAKYMTRRALGRAFKAKINK